MKRHLEKHPLPWLAIEWSELGESDDRFLNEMRWLLEGWNDPTRTRRVTLSKTLVDHLLFRKPAVLVQTWRDELMKWAGLDLSLGIPAPASGASDEEDDDSNAHFYRLHPSLDG